MSFRFLIGLLLLSSQALVAEPTGVLAVTDELLSKDTFRQQTVSPPDLFIPRTTKIRLEMSSPQIEVKVFKNDTAFESVESRNGFQEFKLANGDLLAIPQEGFLRGKLVSWAVVENGFLLIRHDARGEIHGALYLSHLDLLSISLELDEMPSKQEVIQKILTNHLFWVQENLKKGFVWSSSGYESQPNSEWERAKERYSAEIGAANKELREMLSKTSRTLEKLDPDYWDAILTILVGESESGLLQFQGKKPGENARPASLTQKLLHTGVSVTETYGAYRFARYSLRVVRTKVPAATTLSRFNRLGGATLGVISSAVLFYDASERAYLVWALGTEPTWSPVGSALLATDAVQRAQNWVLSKHGFISHRERYRLTTDEFFQGLSEDPRKPQNEVPPPPMTP